MVFCYGSSSRWIEALSFRMGSPFLECELLIGRDPLCWWPCVPTSSLVLTDWQWGSREVCGMVPHCTLTTLHPRIPQLQVHSEHSPPLLPSSPVFWAPAGPWRRLSLHRTCAECWFTSFSQRLGGLMSPLALVKCTPSPRPVPAAALLTARAGFMTRIHQIRKDDTVFLPLCTMQSDNIAGPSACWVNPHCNAWHFPTWSHLETFWFHKK